MPIDFISTTIAASRQLFCADRLASQDSENSAPVIIAQLTATENPKYRDQRNKDLDNYYQQAAKIKQLPVQRLLAKIVFIIFKLGPVKIRGIANIPDSGPYIIAAAHPSVFDPLLGAIIAYRHPLRFVAKSQLFTAAYGRLLLSLGAFPIRRGHYDRQAFDLCAQLLDRGQSLLLFPQGGVTNNLAPESARWGVGLVAQLRPVPVIPMLITYRRWSITIDFGPEQRFFPQQQQQQQPGDEDNQRVAEQIMAAISALLLKEPSMVKS